MQSLPLQVTLTSTAQYFIIPLDRKCAVHNTAIQIDVTNTSGTIQYQIERTLWPVQKCVYPTFNTPIDTLNAQAQWVQWVAPTLNGGIYQNLLPVTGLKVTLLNAAADDLITITLTQQGVL